MPVRIKFDSSYNVCTPVFVLSTRNGRKLGAIPAKHIVVRDVLNGGSELSFSVHKTYDGIDFPLWNQLKDFKLMWCRDWDIWFELKVELSESNSLIKNVTAKAVGESELSQIKIYNIEINTESDILNDDYVPTVLFNETEPKGSLLNRILEKAPHYKIGHVDSSIAKIQRTFTFDNISIYDAFQKISEEINCLFIIDSGSDKNGKISRTINVYDLESYCLDCKKRDEFMDVCPECGSTNILPGYGKNTTIFVSSDNLAENIDFSSDVGSVKNCFKLVAGDDLMTATLMNCNPNGSGYIWYLSKELKEDMSEELVEKLNSYDKISAFYQNEYSPTIPSSILSSYNSLINKYAPYSDKLVKIPSKITGFPELMNALYSTIDFELFLSHELMPNIEIADTTAQKEASKLTSSSLAGVAVQNLKSCSAATASSAVLSMAKVLVDPRYKVKVEDSAYSNGTWTGSFTVVNHSNEEDIAATNTITVSITDQYEKFVKQKLDKMLHKSAENISGIVDIFDLSDNNFKSELKKYSLSQLTYFHDACQGCLDILIEQGIANKDTWASQNSDLYNAIYVPYYNKLQYINNEISVRESEIAIIIGKYDTDGDLVSDGMQTILEKERSSIQEHLNFEKYLGEELWLEFAAYRREDTYQNTNYISDGLDNAELFNNALEFIETAKKEIVKSATLQHSITASLKNLLVMKEFKPLVDYFEVGNWIRVRVDQVIYKLRIIDFEIDFDNLANLQITFSDVKAAANGISDIESILDQAASMSTSYDSVSRQAGHGEKSNGKLDDWVNDGLALTKMKIIDSAENQNITFDSHGLLCKEYLPITDSYDDKQLKIINRGLYLTDDNWLTSRAGIGDFTFYNPDSGMIEDAYGVIADKLVGNLILSKKVGIYNEKNTVVIGENGLSITSDLTNNSESPVMFLIQKKILSANDGEVLEPIMYLDADGNMVLNGTIRINTATDQTVTSLDDLADTNRLTPKIDEIVNSHTKTIYDEIDAMYQDVIEDAANQLENYKADLGQYLQFDENGLSIGATTSEFKTVIDNRGMYFKQGDTTVSYINNSQLHINNAVIESTLMLGKFFFSPRGGDGDGGVSLIWKGE